MKVSILGASGYIGGELLRLILTHPEAELFYSGSNSQAGKYIHKVHPNLRGLTMSKMEKYNVSKAVEADVVFTALPHGQSMDIINELFLTGVKIIDLSADFRLRDHKIYNKYYREHKYPELLTKSVYGLPEIYRSKIKSSQLIANPGCNAMASILALMPIIHLVDTKHIISDVKVGSSAAGVLPNLSTHHPERTNVVRPYNPVGHRHTGEIEQELSLKAGKKIIVGMTPHAVDLVRGILCTAYTYPISELDDKDIWKSIRDTYHNEPFIRIVKEKKGLYNLPNPKIVIGSNFCDVGFENDIEKGRLIMFSAIDNLIKGGSGNAVQNMNIMFGIDEKAGLLSPSLHP